MNAKGPYCENKHINRHCEFHALMQVGPIKTSASAGGSKVECLFWWRGVQKTQRAEREGESKHARHNTRTLPCLQCQHTKMRGDSGLHKGQLRNYKRVTRVAPAARVLSANIALAG
jgi:hypothetical protein